jgi:hypothetical protein
MMSRARRLVAAADAGKDYSGLLLDAILSGEKSLESVFQGIADPSARVRFGCSKALLLLSSKAPDRLYPWVDRLAELLKHDNRILKWNGIAILGNLAALDRGRKIQPLLPTLFSFLSCGELITANTSIEALGKIAKACPKIRGAIIRELLGVEHHTFATLECRNIALGKVLLALDRCTDPENTQNAVVEFAERQTGNKRAATGKKAAMFSRKLQKQRNHEEYPRKKLKKLTQSFP